MKLSPDVQPENFLRLNDASEFNQIVNLFWVANNTMGMVVGPPLDNPGVSPEYQLYYITGPFNGVMVRPWGLY